MRVEQKVLNRGLHCEGPGACIYHSRLKFFQCFFLKWRKKHFYWLKIWRKFRYMWYVYLSRPMFKSMFTRKEGHGNPKHMTFVSFVLPMTSGPWTFCECIGEFEKCSNLLYRLVYLSRKFGESFARALAKDGLHLKARWPKLWAC